MMDLTSLTKDNISHFANVALVATLTVSSEERMTTKMAVVAETAVGVGEGEAAHQLREGSSPPTEDPVGCPTTLQLPAQVLLTSET